MNATPPHSAARPPTWIWRKYAYIPEASGEHRQDVAPADIPLKARKKIQDVGREVLGTNGLGLGEAAHLGIPHRLRHRLHLVPEAQGRALVVVRAHVHAKDDLVRQGKLVEVQQAQGEEERPAGTGGDSTGATQRPLPGLGFWRVCSLLTIKVLRRAPYPFPQPPANTRSPNPRPTFPN